MAITIENQHVKYVIDEDGRNLHFIDQQSGVDCLERETTSWCASVEVLGRIYAATSVKNENGRLLVRFAEAHAELALRVTNHPGSFLLEVESVTGDVDTVVFVNIPTRWQAAAGESFCAGTLALNLQTNVEELPGPQHHLWAACYRRFGFAGARAGLIACPHQEMRGIMKQLLDAVPGVLRSPLGGPWALDSALPGGSYLFGSPTEADVDDWIALCRAIGFTQIDFCGCLNYGDYQPFPKLYPRGYASVRAVTDKLRAAGILSGLHTLSFSISKNCGWVTPQPDPRLAKERSYTLAQAIGAEDTTVPLVESMVDLPEHTGYYIRRSKTLQVDNELIEYAHVKRESPYAVVDCKRGALGTQPAAHARDARVHHLKECWDCFLPDGDSTLFNEVAARIGDVIEKCGFAFTYLDGLDGAHVIGGEQYRWHYGAKFAYEVYRCLSRPIMIEMAAFHHHLWFIRSRMQAWDHAFRGHKAFIDLHVRSNEAYRRIFMPLHLGWSYLLVSGDPEWETTFNDDVEYMWCRGLGTGAGFSLQGITPHTFATEPWVRRVVPIIRTYESLRQQNYFSEPVKKQLCEPGAEYTLMEAPGGAWQFQPMRHIGHKVEGANAATAAWQVINPFGRQPLRVRIQALCSAGSYEAPGNIMLADFTKSGEFPERGVTETILNSGKVYAHPSAAPGLSGDIYPAHAPVKGAQSSGCWTAVRAVTAERVCSSAPDDAFSLEDHAERLYRPRQASWIRVGKYFTPGLNLSEHHGVGVWIYGDNQGELINIQLCCFKQSQILMDHYVRIDFAGWRYFELIEPEAERFETLSWPYGRCLYGSYRKLLDFKDVNALFLWYNDIPVGRTVTCYLSPIKALPLVKTRIVRPRLTLNGRTWLFPIEIENGSYLEFDGRGQCHLVGAKGEILGLVRPEGGEPELMPGSNTITFQCDPAPHHVRANVTVIARGNEPLCS